MKPQVEPGINNVNKIKGRYHVYICLSYHNSLNAFLTDPNMVGQPASLRYHSSCQHGTNRCNHLQDLLLHVRPGVVHLVSADGSPSEHGKAHLQSKAELRVFCQEREKQNMAYFPLLFMVFFFPQ